MKINKECRLMFLLGLGSATKVYLGGVIAFSELAVFALSPFLIAKHYQEMKRDGFIPIILLPLTMIVGCFISCRVNHAPMFAFVKCSMMYYSISAAVVAFYVVLRRNLSGIGYFFLGMFISQIIAVFAFNPQISSSTDIVEQLSVEEQMEGVLFWYPKIARALYLPVQMSYLSIPSAYSVLAPIITAIVSLIISVSGRSAAAMSLVSCFLIFLCRKSRRKMRKLGQHFLLFVLLMCVVAYGIKAMYSYSAKSGLLGEEARLKYEVQTRGNNSFLRILIGGRTQFFITVRALMDNPVIGVGPQAIDKKGYVQEFLSKYGEQEDFDYYIRSRMQHPGYVERLPQHSVVTQFWGQAGILGLVFCLYYLYMVYSYYRRYACCIPQWYGYLSIAIPSSVFTLFFNPYTERMTFPLLITCLLLSKAVGRGRIMLPLEMEIEARKYE